MTDLLNPDFKLDLIGSHGHIKMAYGARKPVELVFAMGQNAPVRFDVFCGGVLIAEKTIKGSFSLTQAPDGLASPPAKVLPAFDVAHVVCGPLLFQAFFTGPRHTENDPELRVQLFRRDKNDSNNWLLDKQNSYAFRNALMRKALAQQQMSAVKPPHRNARIELHVWF